MARSRTNSIDLPSVLLEHTEYQPLLDHTPKYHNDEFSLRFNELDDEMLAAIVAAAEAAGKTGPKRLFESIILARQGKFDKKIGNLKALPEILAAYFSANLHDGWIYRRAVDGHLLPWLVTEIYYSPSDGPYQQSSVTIDLVANGSLRTSSRERGSKFGYKSDSVSINGDSIKGKTVTDLLLDQGLYVETPALREDYDKSLAKHREILRGGFAQQYRFTGTPHAIDNYRDDKGHLSMRKVVHDTRRDEIGSLADFAASMLFEPLSEVAKKRVEQKLSKDQRTSEDDWGTGPVPIHPVLHVFDLGSHDFYVVNTDDVERYVYDKTLGEKIVLPEDQRNLLDILTSDLDDFTGDVIEGKSAGNVVLCKGEPGVGKTLTAEIYSELIERPLYSIHSGNLGINAKDIRENLETTFARIKRWNAVLLLDEADVFVLERGDNIEQNAIVAEFLRTLEYFDGLMFMTTNRANNIDDAILSRAAAIIDYALPDMKGIRAVWVVQAKNQGVVLPDDLLNRLVHGFVKISPRDVKMLLRLSLRVAKSQGVEINVDIAARCAMFRGLHYEAGARQ